MKMEPHAMPELAGSFDPTAVSKPNHVPNHLVVDFDLDESWSGGLALQERWLRLSSEHEGQIIWTPRNGGHWIMLRGAAIMETFRDWERFSSAASNVPRMVDASLPPILPINIDPPLHGVYRKILNPFGSPRLVRAQEESIRSLASSLITGFHQRGTCEFLREFASKVPLVTLFKLADLPEHDYERLAKIAERVTRPITGDDFAPAITNLVDYFRPFYHQRQGSGEADLLSVLANARIGEKPISEDEFAAMAAQFVGAGIDTVAAVLGFIMQYLAAHPDKRRWLAADPKRIAKSSIELIRRFPTASVARLVRQEIALEEVTLQAGDMVLLPTALANLDSRLFPDPLEVNFDRPPAVNLTFGGGPHRCAGAALAQSEIILALEEWLQRIPDFEVDADTLRYKNGITGTMIELPLRW
jgi:cytochrome P450